MDNAKKERNKRVTVLNRWIKELHNLVKAEAHATNTEKKLGTLVNAMEDVGLLHDEVMSLAADDTVAKTEDEWYDELDSKVNGVIKVARMHIDKIVETKQKSETKQKPEAPQFKLKKIEMPTLSSDHRTYYKWKEQFDHYTNHLDDDMK